MARKVKTGPPEFEADLNCCELCGRNVPLTKHHLIPRAVHGTSRFEKMFDKNDMRCRSLMICRLCHSGIHDLIPSEKELAEKYNTKELLLGNESIQKHVSWVRKQK